MNTKRLLENALGWLINIPCLGLYRIFGVSIHHSMTKGDCIKLHKASFAEFRQAFMKVEWRADEENDLYDASPDDGRSNYLCASIVRFNNVGYLLTTVGLIRANRLMLKTAKRQRYQ